MENHRTLRQADFHARTARNEPFLSKLKRKFRVKLAKNHINKDETYCKEVVFADGSKLNLLVVMGSLSSGVSPTRSWIRKI